jgi:hypothetical protein
MEPLACGESNVFWMEESDTLTEDLDLSYRAQLKNWEFKYLENVVTPAELPAIIKLLRSHSLDGIKGAENFSKMPLAYSNQSLLIEKKAHGMFHLLNSTMFL